MKIQTSRHFLAKLASRRCLRASQMLPLTVALTASLFASHSAQAASATWNVNADGAWNLGTNWNPTTPPGAVGTTTNTDIATFGTVITAARTVTVDAGRNVFGVDFAGNSSAYTLATGPLVLTSGGYIQTSLGGSSHTDTVSAPITLAGDATFATNSTTIARILAIGSTVTGSAGTGATSTLTLAGIGNSTSNNIAGVIADGANGGKLAVVKNDGGTWAFSSTANTFSGGLTVNGGTMRTSATGNTSALFGTGTITLAGGQLNFGATGGATFNNALVVNGSNTLLIRGNSTFNPTSMTGTGTLTVNNSNVSSGVGAATVFTSGGFQNFGGTVDIQSNANAAATTTLRLATAFTQNSLQNATLNLGDRSSLTQQASTSVGITTTIGALSGTGTLGGGGGGSGTFTYSIGNKNIDSTFAGIIQNAATNPTALTKTGTATQTLSGASSFTGAVTVSAGTLATNLGNNTVNPATSALGNPQVARNITINNGGTLQFANGDTLGGATSTIAATLVINAGGTVTNNGTSFNTLGAVNLNGGTLTGTGGSSNGQFQMYAFGGNVTVAGTSASTISGAGTTGGGTAASSVGYHLGTGVTSGTTFNVGSTGATGGDLVVSGTLIDRTGGAGAASLTKTGAGTMTLSAANTYTGTTTINAGTLLLSTGSINASPSVSVSGTGALTLQSDTALDDAGTLTLVTGTSANSTSFNLNGANGTSEIIATLILDGTTEPAGTYTADQLMALDPNITFTSSLGETLTIGAVPEASTYLGGLLMVGALGWSQRRRLKGSLVGA